MENKEKQIKLSLIGVASVQTLSIIFVVYELNLLKQSISQDGSFTDTLGLPLYSFIPVVPSLLLVLTLFSTLEQKNKNLTAWISALLVFILSLPSLALPFSIFGLLAVLNDSVRKPHLESLLK
jgi:hypothetical protein